MLKTSYLEKKNIIHSYKRKFKNQNYEYNWLIKKTYHSRLRQKHINRLVQILKNNWKYIIQSSKLRRKYYTVMKIFQTMNYVIFCEIIYDGE